MSLVAVISAHGDLSQITIAANLRVVPNRRTR
jgi:hypothetical protein